MVVDAIRVGEDTSEGGHISVRYAGSMLEWTKISDPESPSLETSALGQHQSLKRTVIGPHDKLRPEDKGPEFL